MSIQGIGNAWQPYTGRVTPSAPTAKKDDGDFSARLDAAIRSVSESQGRADDKLEELARGHSMDIHGTMIALQEADITLRTMVAVRDKVVEAYNEVMNLQV